MASNATVEREVKFRAESLEVEELPGEPLDERVFTSVYYDCDQERLFRAGLTLRRRMEHGGNCWQLKLGQGDARLEVEERGGPAGPPPQIQVLLRAVLRGRELSPVATLRTHRSGRKLDGALVTLDQVEVLEGLNVVDRFAEIEAEITEGGAKALRRVERKLRKAGARPTSKRSKLERALGRKAEPPPRSSARAPARDRLCAYVREQLDELVRHDPLVRVGDDPEDVHDMRVAVRRLRAVLRVARPMLERQWAERLRAELDWLAHALAPVRDLDVLIAHFQAESAALDAGDAVAAARLVRPLEEERRSAREALLAVLETDRYLALLDAVEAASEAPPVRRADISLRRRANKEMRKVRKQERSLGDWPSAAALHKTRIRGKRARYAVELACPRQTKPVKRFLKAAKSFQDTLGQHQDALVAAGKLRDLARIVPDASASVAAGRLIERQHERMASARSAHPKSWKRLKRAGQKLWS